MFLLLVAFALAVPFVELWIIIQVGQSVGFIPTIAALFVISLVGSSVVKYEGLRVYRDFVGAIRRGEVPSREIVHGACVLLAGVFLLSPGFFTDVLALLLLLPPVRALFARMVVRRTTVRVASHRGPGSAHVIDVEGRLSSERDARP